MPSPVASSSVQRRPLALPGEAARADSVAGSATAAPPISETPHIIVMNVDRTFERMDRLLGKRGISE
ncbi:hypothetical protein ACN28I_04880 [Archangium gephyra]|uniref:hypothetical protein n=1 Tax=Archangium gephyra TaxID=48 RepID=UPI003B8085B1